MTEENTMIRISIEVKNGGESFVVAAQAKSIERALNSVRGAYSATEAKVVFPLDPDTFFVEGGAVRRELSGARL